MTREELLDIVIRKYGFESGATLYFCNHMYDIGYQKHFEIAMQWPIYEGE